MNPVIVYPLPFDDWREFEKYAIRFTDTFRQYPPGIRDYEVVAVCIWGHPTDAVKSMFYGIKTRYVAYCQQGCDIGAAQMVAKDYSKGHFIIAMTSRCYFHREGWLSRYMQARDDHGPGLYGATASHEGGKAHICTRGYAMDADLWNRYPHLINRREFGEKFEVGEWCVTDFVRGLGGALVQVTWDREHLEEKWRDPWEKEIYRRGDQNACLIWDKHTDLWRDASPEMKQHLSDLADGISRAT